MADYIIIGAGPAGILAAQRIRLMEDDAQIAVISADEHVHSRCMLHKYLSHERSVEKINFVPEDFFEKNHIEWIKGKKVKKVTPEEKTVELDDESVLPYKKLLIATGAGFVIPRSSISERRQMSMDSAIFQMQRQWMKQSKEKRVSLS